MSRPQSRQGSPVPSNSGALLPPSPSPGSGGHSPTSSIASVSSDIFINSYYLGNDEMPDLTLGASTGARRAARRRSSPTGSFSGEEGLTRRGSGGSRESFSDGTRQRQNDEWRRGHTHETSGSSADVGVIRGPLDFGAMPDILLSTDDNRQEELSTHHRAQSDATAGEIGMRSPSVMSVAMGGGGSEMSHMDSDRAILTANQTQRGYDRFGNRLGDDIGRDSFSGDADDVELEDGADTSRPTVRSSADAYGFADGGGGLQRARSGLHRMSKSIRRMSRRVVHLEGQNRATRLPDDDDDSDHEAAAPPSARDGESAPRPEPAPLAEEEQALRGKSLGIWGPESGFRKMMASLLSHWWIEPLILALIVGNVVILILQSSRSVFKDPRKPGYFDYWEDYVLLAIFAIFTLEIFARVVVSGLVVNPPPMYPPGYAESPTQTPGENPEPDFNPIEHKRRMSQSNTLESFSKFGDSLKNRMNAAVRPRPSYELDSRTSSKSPYSTSGYAAARTTSGDLIPTLAAQRDGQFAPPGRQLTRAGTAMMLPASDPSAFMQGKEAPFAQAIVVQRAQAAHYAYLRHSWNRVDLLAVVCFWVSFFLAVSRQESSPDRNIYIFRALSVLRSARLLTATSGTTTILQSLKKAGPLLVNVTFFTVFSMVLFSIIGIQSFKGSYRRSCVWVGDIAGDPGTNYTLSQICGGYVDAATGASLSHITKNGERVPGSAKGFICPVGQVCVEADSNPEDGVQSFDNIFASMMQVVIVISSNNWSQTMYDMIDADYYASCLFFIIGLIIMNFWMANLFVAVITNTFAAITAETKQSAFAAQKIEPASQQPKEETATQRRRQRVANVYKRVWGYTKYLWLLAIVADLGVQASRASYETTAQGNQRDTAELYFTIAFDVEILMRFFSYLLDSDYRLFFKSKRNMVDFFLAVITSVIQIPPIHHSAVYPWLTAFQLARFYRVIAAVPRMQALLIRVFGSMSGLFNMILFLLLMVGLASIIAVQLFRGDIPQDSDSGSSIEINFKQIYNSWLGMYQVFTSENWTTVLYDTLSTETQYQQAVIAGIFICGWFLFANFIVLQMFIAVINENFGVAEEQKRQQQLEMYLRRNEPAPLSATARMLYKFSPYKHLRELAAGNGATQTGNGAGGAQFTQPADGEVDEEKKNRMSIHHLVNPSLGPRTIETVRKILRLDRPEESVPMDTLRSRQFRQSLSAETTLQGRNMRQASFYEGEEGDAAQLFANERQLARLRTSLGLNTAIEQALHQANVNAEHATRGQNDPRIQQARFINTNPSYDKSLWLFSNRNQFRRFCQSLVPPSYGERLFGRPASRFRHLLFQTSIFIGIAGSVVVAGIATPAYRLDYYDKYGMIRASWFSITEISLSIFFFIEFGVKVIADGLLFTPNAYMLSVWNALDLFVLVTLIVNVTTELIVIGGISRFTRALKAFRALRLINLSSLMRDTFHAVMIAGAGRILDASVLAILYIIPYAVWGQNLFAGLLYSCNDGGDGISSKADCYGEYSASPSQWNFLAPRVWANPTEGTVYSFDDFKSSLLILFEIVSLEGWIDVMTAAMSIAGKDQQLQPDNRQVNAMFFVIYNLVGAIFVLTLFVSVIIESFQAYSGAAYLTTEQRQWIDLKRLIMRQRPSKRPKVKPADSFRAWCYDRTVQKHGWWSRGMTVLYVLNIIVLMTQRYHDPGWVERLRDVIYLGFTVIYAADIGVRLLGLGWRSFRENPWNLYDLIVVTGTLATTIPLLNQVGNQTNIQFQKIFLTGVAFKLVQKSNALNQLFKTAIGSLPAILNLFLLWFTMFLVWGIMLVEVFGLTKWGPNETYSKNFSTLLRSLVFLSMMSTGEGWNAYMHDYTVSDPDCTPSTNYLHSDCGSQGWAFALFISWNVISMYIFLNMFTGTVVENFSYVFQLGGKPSLSREQMRGYKKVWAEFDPHRTGYVARDKFIPFFRKLSGVLEVRIYPLEGRVATLMAASSAANPPASPLGPKSPSKSPSSPLGRLRAPLSPPPKDANQSKSHFMFPPPSPVGGRVVNGIDIGRLKRALSKIDYEQVAARREMLNRLYHEALLSEEKGKGISFTNMLLLIAHYKLVDDDQALEVGELIERRTRKQRVDDKYNLERVRGVMRMVYLRRRFLALREERQLAAQQADTSVPTILVDSSPTRRGRPDLSLDMSYLGGSSLPRTPPSQTAQTDYFGAAAAASSSPSKRSSLQPSPSLLGPGSRFSDDTPTSGPPSISVSPAVPSLADVETRGSPVLESSAWGDIMRRMSRHAKDTSENSERPARGPSRQGSNMGDDDDKLDEKKSLELGEPDSLSYQPGPSQTHRDA